jgi:phosphoribosylaminoimidazole carboxylase (NCAIR synthetase)
LRTAIQAAYLDAGALGDLADGVDAVTTEFENVPAEALAALARRRRVAPSGVRSPSVRTAPPRRRNSSAAACRARRTW